MPPEPQHLPASRALPPITRLPGEDNALATFIAERTRPWGGVPLDVPGVVATTLWGLLVANAGVAAWLTDVVSSGTSCSGFACTVATWGHPQVLLVLAAASVVSIVAAGAWSRGLTSIAPLPLGIAAAGGAFGLVAVSGVATLLALVLTALLVVGGIAVAFVDRF